MAILSYKYIDFLNGNPVAMTQQGFMCGCHGNLLPVISQSIGDVSLSGGCPEHSLPTDDIPQAFHIEGCVHKMCGLEIFRDIRVNGSFTCLGHKYQIFGTNYFRFEKTDLGKIK